MAKYILILSFFSINCYTAAQNEIDALRYSFTSIQGTSRFSSMGGAFTSLGTDFSSLSINPAGVATVRKSELTITPTFSYQQANTSFSGNENIDGKYAMLFNNIGIVITSNNKGFDSFFDKPRWSFGFGYNRLANFNNRMSIEGVNATGSLINVYENEANESGVTASEIRDAFPFGSGLAFYTYLIDTVPGDTTTYFGRAPAGGMLQQKLVETSGGSGEMLMSIGGNFSDKLFLGFTVGFPRVRYNETSTHTETDEQDTISDISAFTVTDNLATSGEGINFKMGFIYKPVYWLRLGASFHSPTFYDLSETYSTTMTADYDNGQSFSAESPEGYFNYQLITPYKVLGGASLIFGRSGLVSFDYEYIDYTTARLTSDEYAYFDENETITSKYNATHNVKIGTEWRLQPMSFRLGYALYGSPYANKSLFAGGKNVYSAGIGIREKGYFIDLAYVVSEYQEEYYLYDPELIAASNNQYYNHSFMFTIGIVY